MLTYNTKRLWICYEANEINRKQLLIETGTNFLIFATFQTTNYNLRINIIIEIWDTNNFYDMNYSGKLVT